MKIDNGDCTFSTGPFDVILILHHTETGRFHVCFAEEYPLPGLMEEWPTIVRLKSSMTHTAGAATLAEAQEHVEALRRRLRVIDENVWPKPLPWEGAPFVEVVPNWRKRPVAANAVHASAPN